MQMNLIILGRFNSEARRLLAAKEVGAGQAGAQSRHRS